MPYKPRMLILLFTELAKEPRAHKQILRFSTEYDVTTVGYGAPTIAGVDHLELPAEVAQPILLRKILFVLHALFFALHWYRMSYWCVGLHRWAWSRLSAYSWDVIIAHDVNTVPLANRLRPRGGVLVDLHEYAPRQYEHSPEWVKRIAPYYSWLCRREVARAAAIVTVSQGIVDEYRRQFGFEATLVSNATPYAQLEPGPVHSPLRLVHSGIAAPARKLDIMIEAVLRTVTPVTLDLYLVNSTSAGHLDDLKALANGDERVRFREPVPYAALVETLNTYDVGICIIAPTTFNHTWSLPNKFFDYVQARLGVIIGPSPEMLRLVKEHRFGINTEEFDSESLTKVLDALDAAQVEEWKRNSAAAARPLSGEKQVDILDEIVGRVLDRSRASRGGGR
jgi:hypothetical protein